MAILYVWEPMLFNGIVHALFNFSFCYFGFFSSFIRTQYTYTYIHSLQFRHFSGSEVRRWILCFSILWQNESEREIVLECKTDLHLLYGRQNENERRTTAKKKYFTFITTNTRFNICLLSLLSVALIFNFQFLIVVFAM